MRGDKLALTLSSKLIAWATDNGEAAILVLLVKFLKTSILLCKTTLGRDVNDENDLEAMLAAPAHVFTHIAIDVYFSLELAQVPIIVLDIFDSKIEELGHCSGSTHEVKRKKAGRKAAFYSS